MTTTVDPSRTDQPAPARHTEMVRALAKLRPARARGIPLETILLWLGAFCLPTGLMAIVVAWYGIAHTGHVYEQNSYLISGGVFGLGLVITGGFMYFGYWMTRQINATATSTQVTQRALGRLEDQLSSIAAALNAQQPAAVNGSNGRSTRAQPTATGPRPVELVATAHGTLLHRVDCPTIADKAGLRPVEAGTPGYRSCQVCAPKGA